MCDDFVRLCLTAAKLIESLEPVFFIDSDSARGALAAGRSGARVETIDYTCVSFAFCFVVCVCVIYSPVRACEDVIFRMDQVC